MTARKNLPPNVAKANASSDEAGRVFSCRRCKDWTGDPVQHLARLHPEVTVTAQEILDGFTLIRGALHKQTPTRPKKGTELDGQDTLPYGD